MSCEVVQIVNYDNEVYYDQNIMMNMDLVALMNDAGHGGTEGQVPAVSKILSGSGELATGLCKCIHRIQSRTSTIYHLDAGRKGVTITLLQLAGRPINGRPQPVTCRPLKDGHSL